MRLESEPLTPFIGLGEHLHRVSQGRHLVYIPNPGNYGDGLIRYASRQFFADQGLQVQELNLGYSQIRSQLLPWLLRSGKYHFVYGGGGGWLPQYGFARHICQFISHFTDQLTILPSTFAVNARLRGTAYRRDETESRTWSPDSLFCHDMAIYLAAGTNPVVSILARRESESSVGLALRSDAESAIGGKLPDSNDDVSTRGDHMSLVDAFLERISRWETIYTDRLHIAIAGCLLQRQVRLIGNNYFKIRAVYESSLRPIFGDRVQMLDALPEALMNREAGPSGQLPLATVPG